jgi:hypothetical protein
MCRRAGKGLAFLLMSRLPVLEPGDLPALEGELIGTALLADPSRVPAALRNVRPLNRPWNPLRRLRHQPPGTSPITPRAQEVEILRLPAHRVEALEARLMAVGQLRDAASLLLRKTSGAEVIDQRP